MMKHTTAMLKRFVGDDSGTTAIEYGLIATLIAVTILGAIFFTGNVAGNLFNTATNAASDRFVQSSNLLN